MAYLDIDLLGPIAGAFLTNTKTRNLILSSNIDKWPTKWVDIEGVSTEVFDKMFIFTNDHVVPHDKMYGVLGMSGADIVGGNDVSKVQDIWLYLKPVDVLTYDNEGVPEEISAITSTQVAEYINEHSSLNSEIEIEILYTQTVASQNVRTTLFANKEEELVPVSKEQIIAMIEGGYNSTYPVPIIENVTKPAIEHKAYSKLIGFDTKTSAVTFASLMDTNDDLFESSTSILSYSVAPAYSTKWDGEPGVTSLTITATALYTFKRTVDATDVAASTLIDLITDKANTETNLRGQSMYSQLGDMVRAIRPISDSNLFATVTVTSGDDVSGYTDTVTEYIKVGTDAVPEILIRNLEFDPEQPETEYLDVGAVLYPGDNPSMFYEQRRVEGTGMRSLKRRDFTTLFARMIESDYVLKPVKKKWYSGLLTIIIIVVVVYLSVITAGAASGVSGAAVAAGTASLAATAAFMSAFAISMAVGVLATSMIAKSLADGGHYGIAVAFSNSVVVLNTLSTISGYISMATGIGAMIEGFKSKASEALTKEAIKEAGKEVTEQTMKEYAVTAGMSEVISHTISTAADAAIESVGAVFTEPMSLFANKSLSQVFNQAISYLNTAFTVYTKIFPPETVNPAEPIDDSTIQPTRLDSAELVARYMDSDQMYELNLLMDNMPYNMTEGTIDRAFDKYYSNSRPV